MRMLALNRSERSAAICSLIIGGWAASAGAQEKGDASMVLGASGIARFVEKGVDPSSFAPSIALARPREVRGEVTADIKAAPLFWTSPDGRNCVRVDIEAGTSLYGTGEIAGPLLRNGRKSVCW